MNDYGFGAPDGRDIVIGELEDRNAAYKQRIADLEAQVQRLRAFAEEMSWYAPPVDWEDAAQRLLRYGDVRTVAEIQADGKGTDGS